MPGPSFILGHDKGGLVAIAHDRTCRQDRAAWWSRKDLGITKVERAQGQEDRQPDRLLDRQHLRRPDRAGARPEEGRLPGSPHERQRHGRRAWSAKTVDAMVNVEPYNAIAEADGIGTSIMDFSSVDKMPVFMAATPDFVDKNPDAVVAYLKAWLEVASDFKDNPNKVADVIYSFFTSKGYSMSQETFAKALAPRRGRSRLPGRSRSPTCSSTPRCCCRRRRSPPSRTGRRRCGRTSWRRPAAAEGRRAAACLAPRHRTR